MKAITLLSILTLVGVQSAAAQMQCPVGTYQWVDGWGNNTCRSFQSQRDVVTQANPATGMPNGAMPTVDAWGNQTSTGSGSTSGTTYYNTSRGCPTGTFPWTDSWGNPTCKHF